MTATFLDEAEITRLARRAGGTLKALGCKAGDRLAVLAGNGAEFVVLRDAATALDLVFAPLNPRLAAPEIAELVARTDARLLVADSAERALPEGVETWFSDDLQRMGEGVTQARAKDPQAIGATILFTSGTTGRAKACLRPAAAEKARTDELRATYGISASDVHLIACPLAHSAPGIFLRACRAAGARTAILPRFEARGFLAEVARTRATLFFLVPTQIERLLALPEAERRAADWSSVRAVIVAGAPFAAASKRRLLEWIGPGKLWEFYGASETGTISVMPPAEQPGTPGCVGRAAAGVRIELRDSDGRAVPAGETGEIFVTSASVMAGYIGEPPVVPGEPVSVGDLGRLDQHGRLTLVDRKHDLVISGGVNVYPAEVERALCEHPDVAAAVVCGVPDDEWGERVVALVAAQADTALDEAELRGFLRERIAAYKIPKAFRFLPLADLPIGPSGKPLRRVARTLFSAGS